MRKNAKKIVYTLCFIMLCLIDQRTKTGTGLDGWIETFRDLVGVVMAILILSHYKMQNILEHKKPYVIWSVVCVVGLIPAIIWGLSNRPFLNDWIVVLLNIVLYGYVFICVFQDFYIHKKKLKRPSIFMILWILMMGWMIISRSTLIWPWLYTIMFGVFYITDYSKEEITDMFDGAIHGIIIAFLMFQAFCCVFRPYDELRYPGAYSNCNLNSLFYLEVLVAAYAKLLLVYKQNKNKYYKVVCWLFTGAVNTLLFITIGRTAWAVGIVLALLTVLYLNVLTGQKKMIGNIAKLLLSFVVMFPICFALVRYTPPIFHHPVWFWGEWNENKVHSFDAWNSEKYVDFDEMMEEATGRIQKTVADLFSSLPTTLHVHATEADVQEGRCLITYTQSENSVFVRKTIYKYYFERLNILGHSEDDQGFQLIPEYRIGHAHNIYLQFGTDFGIPAMLLFIILIISSCAAFFRRGLKGSVEDIAALMFVLVPSMFGLLEFSWGPASLTMIMLYVAWRKMV